MPKEQEPTLVSEPEYDGMSLGEAISKSINDIRAGLLNVVKALLDLVDEDEITIERYTPCYELSNELIVLSKALLMIIGEFKPKICNKKEKAIMEQVEAIKDNGC